LQLTAAADNPEVGKASKTFGHEWRRAADCVGPLVAHTEKTKAVKRCFTAYFRF
jgi:hypothetical protein